MRIACFIINLQKRDSSEKVNCTRSPLTFGEFWSTMTFEVLNHQYMIYEKSFDQEKSRKSIKNQKVKSLTFHTLKNSKCFSMVFSKLWKAISQNFTYKLKKTANMKVVDFDPMNNFVT